MVYYEYHPEIINNNEVKDFFHKTNFIGYILPDGSIYSCNNHNIETLQSYYDMTIYFFKTDYQNKDLFLGKDTNDPLFLIVASFFLNNSLEDIIKFDEFVKKNNLTMSDIIVSFFGCHLVTRLNKRILTSNILHYPFYNYILMGFKIDNVPKIIYRDGEYCFLDNTLYNNDFLMDEIETIQEEVHDDEKPLFFR